MLPLAKRRSDVQGVGDRRSHVDRGDVDMDMGQAEQKKRIVPTVLEKYEEKKKK